MWRNPLTTGYRSIAWCFSVGFANNYTTKPGNSAGNELREFLIYPWLHWLVVASALTRQVGPVWTRL